jgi:hypothetical protein
MVKLLPATAGERIARCLDDKALEEILGVLAERGVLVRTASHGEPAFELARRDWSVVPGMPDR